MAVRAWPRCEASLFDPAGRSTRHIETPNVNRGLLTTTGSKSS